MSHVERKRCFECGASYPPDVPSCEEDHSSLWPNTIGGKWRIEGVLAKRPAGATCAAYHLDSGARVAIDLVRGSAESEAQALQRLKEEVSALRLLDHPNVMRLVAEGTDPDQIHYLVTELGAARPLPDHLEEWQRSPGGLLPLAVITQIGRQILGALAAAHRLGVAHGGLRIDNIFVASDADSLAGFSRGGTARLHGLRSLGLGLMQRTAVGSDIAAVGGVLYELIAGKAPPAHPTPAGRLTLPADISRGVSDVVLRAIGAGTSTFSSADEMLRALLVAAPPSKSEVNAAALAALNRTDPQAPRSMPMTEPEVAPLPTEPLPNTPPPLPRLSGSHALLPAPALPGPPTSDAPVRSRFSGELKQVSLRDLIAQKTAPAGEETLARSRRRISQSSMKLPALPPRDSLRDDDGPPVAGAYNSAEHAALEPTADLHALPVDFASAISGPVMMGSSMSGRSEISLPPQPIPAMPPRKSDPSAAHPSPATAMKKRSDPTMATSSAAPPAKAIEPTAPPIVLFVSDSANGDKADIDPLASTGQAPIPATILEASRRFQNQASAISGPKIDPVFAEDARRFNAAATDAAGAANMPAAIPGGQAAAISKATSEGGLPLWMWVGAVLILILASAGLLFWRS